MFVPPHPPCAKMFVLSKIPLYTKTKRWQPLYSLLGRLRVEVYKIYCLQEVLKELTRDCPGIDVG